MTNLYKGNEVEIIVPVHNALGLTKRCLDSVARHRETPKHGLIIVDDGSEGDTAAYLEEFRANQTNCELLRSEESTGYTKAANRGLRQSSAAMVVLLNSDTEVPPRWVEKMAEVMFGTPGVGIVGPLSNAASHQSIPRQVPNKEERLAGQTVINPMPTGETLETLNLWLEKEMPITPIRVPLVHGFCFAIRRQVLGEIGFFDEESFPRGYGEEDDYCIRAVDAGWSLAIATNVYVWHQKSGSYGGEVRKKLVSQGRNALVRRHGQQRRQMALKAVQESGRTIIESASALKKGAQ